MKTKVEVYVKIKITNKSQSCDQPARETMTAEAFAKWECDVETLYFQIISKKL